MPFERLFSIPELNIESQPLFTIAIDVRYYFHFLPSPHSIKDMFLRMSFKRFMPYAESLSDFMQKKTSIATEQDLLVDLTFHSLPASLLTEFAQKIVRPHYKGNINLPSKIYCIKL
jgi:hypothetical protein